MLDALGLKDETVSRCTHRLGLLLAAQLAMALVGQVLTRPRFEQMEQPSKTASEEVEDGEDHEAAVKSTAAFRIFKSPM